MKSLSYAIIDQRGFIDKARNFLSHYGGGGELKINEFVSVSCCHPQHHDERPSAGIKIVADNERLKKLIFHCFVCTGERLNEIEEIIFDWFGDTIAHQSESEGAANLGCRLIDLFPHQFHEEIKTLGVLERQFLGASCVSFPVCDASGVVGYHNRIRVAGNNKWLADKGIKLSSSIFRALRDDLPCVILCESPVDATTLYLLGYSTIACCGKSNLRAFTTAESIIKGKKIYIWCEPDAPTFATDIAKILSICCHKITPGIEKDAWRIFKNHNFDIRKTRKVIDKLISKSVFILSGTTMDSNLLAFMVSEKLRDHFIVTNEGLTAKSNHCWVSGSTADHLLSLSIKDTCNSLYGLNDTESYQKEIKRFSDIRAFGSVKRAVIDFLPHDSVFFDSFDEPNSGLYLAFSNGIVDLRTGTIVSEPPSDVHLIYEIKCDFNPHAKAKRWEQFISEIFMNDAELIDYVQTVLGSFLCGIQYRNIFVFYGIGRNGKSTLMKVLSTLLGPYSEVIPKRLLTKGEVDTMHPVVFSRFIHCRYAYTEEVGSEVVNSEFLKKIVGGAGFSTRFLYRNDNYAFHPRCKIVLVTNHILKFSDKSAAIQDRIQYIPFKFQIPEDRIIENLAEILIQEESEGIMAWLVEGAKKFLGYVSNGQRIPVPKYIKEITNEYFSEIDPVGTFIEEMCEIGNDFCEQVSTLYDAFVEWEVSINKTPEKNIMHCKSFSSILSSKGFPTIKKTRGMRYKQGLRLKKDPNIISDPPPNPPSDPPSNPPSDPPSDPPSNPPLDLPPDSPSDQNPTPQQQDPDEEPPFDVPEPVVFDPNKATLQSVDEVFSQLELVADFALDLETTGLDPHTDRIRLVSIAYRDLVGIRSAVLEWSDEVREKLAAILSQPELTIVGFNLAFDLAFLQTHGVKFKCKLFDVMLACEVYHGRTHISLEEAAREHLNIQIDKTLQKTDWTGDITPQMIHYAATDAEVTYKLFEKFRGLLSSDVNLAQVVMLENLALPAIVEMSVSGIRIDIDGWKRLTDELEIKRKAIEQQLINIASSYGFTSINPNSVPQVRALLQKAGINVESTSTDILKTIKHPIASLICEYREIQKLCSAYGHDWLARCKGGVCYPRWHQIGSETGRMSCSDPNLQQIPRSTGHRRLIIPRPGHAFVIADYSQIELRLMAEIADDDAMIAAFRNGQDLHRLTASIILDKPQSNITPEERQLAKAINFGLVYGMSAKSLQNYVYSSYGVSISYEQAEQYRRKFLSYYRGVKRFHDYMASKFNRGDKVVTTRLGRRRTCTTLTQMINTPIQGSGADGLKLALAALSKIKNEDIKIVLAVHDEIVIEAPEDQVEKAKELLIKAMKKGMSAILQKVPCEVEAHVARCWEK